MHTQNNATPQPPQIILSNSSLTPAVREHNSTRKTKLTNFFFSFPFSLCPPLSLSLFLFSLETKGAVPSAGHLGKYIFFLLSIKGHKRDCLLCSTGHGLAHDFFPPFSVIALSILHLCMSITVLQHVLKQQND